jgi:hypothetical protein
MNQIDLGASIPFAVAVLVYLVRRGRAGLGMLILTPVAMAAGALWAIWPDVYRLIGDHETYMRLENDPRSDIFMWHYTIDKMESDSRWFLVAFLFMAACLLVAAWRELRRLERLPPVNTSHGQDGRPVTE